MGAALRQRERQSRYFSAMAAQPHMMPSCLSTSADVAVHTPLSSHLELDTKHCIGGHCVTLNSLVQVSVQLSVPGLGVGRHAHCTCKLPSQVLGRACPSTYGG